MQLITLRTYCAGVVTGTFVILLSSSIVNSEEKEGGGIAGNCPADIAPLGGNGAVDVDDLLMVINHWGLCSKGCPPCDGDINQTCQVDVDDLLAVINAWGPCSVCSPDALEPNNSCPGTYLGSLESTGGTASVVNANLVPAGDIDRFYFFVDDSGSCIQDSIKVHVTLTVPSGAGGSYLICSGMFDCPGQPNGTPEVCHTVSLGSSLHFIVSWPEECLQDDSRYVLLRITQSAPVAEQCEPYELQVAVEED